MKCPNCNHIADTALFKCSVCDQAYDQDTLETLQHLDYLLAWLDEEEELLGAQTYTLLRDEVWSQFNDVRRALHIVEPEELAPVAPPVEIMPPPPTSVEEAAPAIKIPLPTPAVTRQPEEIVRELALVEATLKQVEGWVEAKAIAAKSAVELRNGLEARVANLREERAGRSADIKPPSEVEVIDFVFGSLSEWIKNGYILFTELKSLNPHLEQQRTALLQLESVPSPPTAVPLPAAMPKPMPVVAPAKPAPLPPPPKPAPPPSPPKPKRPLINWGKIWEKAIEAFVSGALLRGLLYLGAFMIVVSAIVLVVVYWGNFHPLLQLGFIAAVPASFYAGGYVLRTQLKTPVAGGVFTGIGALLVAVDFAAVYQLGGLAGRVEVNAYWLMASIVCAVIYAFTAWRLPIEFFGYIGLVGLSSTLLALTRVLGLALEWQIAALTGAGVAMVAGGVRLERGAAKWGELARATRRLPQVLIPTTLALTIVLFFFVPGDESLGQTATFLFATLGYGLLAWHFPTDIFAHAFAWSFIGVAGFALQVVMLPLEWYATAAAALAPAYTLTGRWVGQRWREDTDPRRDYTMAASLTSFGLLGIAIFAGFIVLLIKLWAGVLALTLAALVLAWSAYLYRRPILVLTAGGLFILPFSLAVIRWLSDFNVPQPDAWLMGTWAGLALVYLGLAALLRKADRYGVWLNMWAHLLTPLATVGLLINYLLTADDWFSGPSLVALGGIILVYLASAVIHDSARHPALSKYLTWLPDRLERAIFLWPVGFLLPVWLAVAWLDSALDRPWLGATLAALALVYVGLGQLLARRNVDYRFPPHVYSYALAGAGIIVAFRETWALLATLCLVVGVLAALSAVYHRTWETTLSALLFLWPFQLSLELSGLTPHAHPLAYALLASLGYIPLGLVLDRAGRKYALPLYVIGYALAAYAVGLSLLGRFGLYPLDLLWVRMVTPLVVTGLLVFSSYRFRQSPFAWVAILVFPISFGQALTLLAIPAVYNAAAWVSLALVYMLTERLLTRAKGETWFGVFHWPLGTGTIALAVLGLLLTGDKTVAAFNDFYIGNYFPLILAQTLAVGLTVLAARLYRSRWPLYFEPWLAFVPVTLFFNGYGLAVFGRTLTPPQYGLVWSGLGLVHLFVAVRLDQAKARYSHGLYLGGYALILLAILWTLPDRGLFLWSLGLGILAATISALLVHFNRHHTWDELLVVFFGQKANVLRSAVRGTFLWLAAWPFPVWCVLLLRQLNVGGGFQWLGLGAPSLLFLGLALWLRRFERTYAWPLHTAAQFYTALGLIISTPLTMRFLTGPHQLVEEPTALAFILLQTLAVGFYAASSWILHWRFFAHLAAWLCFFPYTLAWVLYSSLTSVQFAWAWTGLAAALLLVGLVIDRTRVRYAHGPYLAGYLLSLFALAWSVSDRLTNLYTLAAVMLLSIISHLLTHYGLHRSFDDFIRFIWRKSGTTARRAAQTTFLFFSAYAFPIWLAQLLAYHEIPLAWRGLALALVAPLYVAAGLALRRVKTEYTWPFYSAGYTLTAIGAMVAFNNELLAIYVLALNAVVYAVSAYIFRQSFWLYLSNVLIPVTALLMLHYNFEALPAPWVAAIFMGLAFLYFGVGQGFDRLHGEKTTDATIASFALPFYAPGYLLSAIALAMASGERSLAITVFTAGVVLYALSAWRIREAVFLYPAAWLAAVPYYLAMTLTSLPITWYGLGWLPLIVGYIALGRFVFQKRSLGISNLSTFFGALTRPAMPFYLLAYALSVSMIVLSQRDPLTLTLAFAAGAGLYLVSAILFYRPVWLYPGLLAGHLALMAFFTIRPSGNPVPYITFPFLAMTWAMALTGYWLSRISAVRGLQSTVSSFALSHLITPSWAQPFFIFAALDLALWQVVALYNPETAIIIATGHALLLGLFAMLWLDTTLAYGGLAFFLLAVGYRLNWAGLPIAEALATVGGIGFGLYLIARIAERVAIGPKSRLRVWPKPLTNAAMFLTALAVIGTLPMVVAHTTASAAALAFAGALYLTIAYRGRYYRLGYLGMAMLQLAWVLVLIVQDITQPQWYAIPAGLYLTGMGFLERRRKPGLFPSLIETLGLAVLLLTSFIQSLDGATGFPYFLLLLIEALLVVWWGAGRRLKIPFSIGLGASALNVVTQVVVLINVYDVNRWIIILGAGLLLVTVAVFVERQRVRLITQAKEWREAIEGWE